MNEENCMCYITYAVPRNMIPHLFPAPPPESSPPMLYPPGFMPDWYRSGSFPEDDYED